MARVFLLDVLECPKYQGRMKFIATIEDPKVIRKILELLGLPLDGPSPALALPPQVDFEEIVYDFNYL